MLPSRQAGDLLAGMWQLINALGKVPKTLIWDRESAIGGKGVVTVPAASFAGTLATRIQLAPPRNPEFKGLVERNNGNIETSFLPGRTFASPAQFNTQLSGWLPKTNGRLVRSTGRRPDEALDADLAAMTALPPVPPTTGLRTRIRPARDYYVGLDFNDYSVDPRAVGRFVDVHATATMVTVTCPGDVVTAHKRCWAKRAVITDPAHVAGTKTLRSAFTRERQAQERATRHPAEGRQVTLRALSDYDVLFSSDFTAAGAKVTS